jgi:hypothetical protein
MSLHDQPLFELEMIVVRQALVKHGYKPEEVLAWDELASFHITSENFYQLIKEIDLSPFQGSDPDPIPEVTQEDVEFIFHDKYWPNETIGNLAAKLGSLVAYLKSLKNKDKVQLYVRYKEVLENYKKSLV